MSARTQVTKRYKQVNKRTRAPNWKVGHADLRKVASKVLRAHDELEANISEYGEITSEKAWLGYEAAIAALRAVLARGRNG